MVKPVDRWINVCATLTQSCVWLDTAHCNCLNYCSSHKSIAVCSATWLPWARPTHCSLVQNSSAWTQQVKRPQPQHSQPLFLKALAKLNKKLALLRLPPVKDSGSHEKEPPLAIYSPGISDSQPGPLLLFIHVWLHQQRREEGEGAGGPFSLVSVAVFRCV